MAATHHGGSDQDDRRDDGRDDRRDDAGPADPRTAIEPSASALMRTPLDFLMAEHLRQRQAAKILSMVADGLINRKTIAGVVRFIEEDMAQHILDEETALFPLLRRKCEADDNIEALLGVLADEHREDEAQSDDALAILRALAAGEEVGDDQRALLQDFADRLRRHIALENGVLLPLARSRLDQASLDIIAQSMIERRSGRRQ